MSNLTVAETIIQQMGGLGKLRAMAGAHTFAADEKSIQFKFQGSRKANICRVELLPSDTYKFQLWKYNRRTFDSIRVYELNGVHWDALIDLFESETGLHLSL